MPCESGGQGKDAAGDKGCPRADHGPARLLGSISALTAAQATRNMLELHIRPGDAMWRAILRRQRTRKS